MAVQTRFAILEIFEQIGTEAGTVGVPWAPFKGSSSSALSFTIDGNPVFTPAGGGQPQNQAWLLIQAWGVSTPGTKIEINGQPLGGLVLPASAGWQSWLTVFTQPSLLVKGTNTVQFVADPAATSNAVLASVVVSWQEEAAAAAAAATDAPAGGSNQPGGTNPPGGSNQPGGSAAPAGDSTAPAGGGQ